MSETQGLTARLWSRRGGLALGGVVAVALSATQVAGTLAAPNVVRTAKLPVVSGNPFPTPLPATIGCESHYDWGGVNTGARITWASAGPGMTYRVIILRNNDPNQVRADFYTTETTYRYRATGTTANASSDRVHIHTVNIASGTTDASRVRSSGSVSHTTYSDSGVLTRCSGDPRYDNPNQPWENSTVWTPGAATFSRMAPLAPDARPADELEAENQTADTATPETITVTSTAGAPAGASTAPAGESAPSDNPGAGTAPGESTSSSSPSPASPAPTTQAPTTVTTTAATTTAVPTGSPWVLLPDGGRAEVVGTRLTVSDADGQVCTTTVGEGAGLRRSGGVLTVTDADGTRTVDTETCALS